MPGLPPKSTEPYKSLAENRGIEYTSVAPKSDFAHIVPTRFGLVQKQLHAALKMFVDRKGLTTAHPFEHRRLVMQKFRDKSIRGYLEN